MADQIYPGFQLTEMDLTVTENYLRQFLARHFEGVEYQNGKPEIDFHHILGTPYKSAFIYGMKLSWKEIKIRLGTNNKMLGKCTMRWNECVYPLPRKENGLLSLENECLQKHLMQGMGNTSPINLFDGEFVKEQLGGMFDFTHTVLFEGKIKPGKESMLSTAGTLLRLRESMPSYHAKYLEMEFLYRLEAVQAVCYLNQNPDFAYDHGSFQTPNGCQHDSFIRGLGPDGTIVNVRDCVDTFGYVPFTAFDRKILANRYLESTPTKCKHCSTDYELLGWDADMQFVAAQCKGCSPQLSKFAWIGENFFRLILNSSFQQKIDKFRERLAHSEDQYLLLIQGLQPLYENISHFEKSAIAAQKMEDEYNRRKLGIQHQVIGDIISVDYIETTTVNRKQHIFWRLELKTKQTEVWRPDGICKISRCNIVPLIPNGKTNGENPILRTLRYENNGMPGRLHRIEEKADGNVLVTLVTSIPMGINLKKGDLVWMVPRPPSIEQNGLQSALSKWRTFDIERKMKSREKILVTIINATFIRKEDWIHDECSVDIWKLKLDLGKHPYWKRASARLSEDYLAADVELEVTNLVTLEKENITAVVRIIAVFLDNDSWTAKAIILVLPNQTIHPYTECKMSMWRAVTLDKEAPRDDLPVPRGLEEVDSDNEDSDYKSIHEKLALRDTGIESLQYVLQPEIEDVYLVARPLEICSPGLENIASIMYHWMERPISSNLSLLDFLLHKSHPTISHDPNVTGRSRPPNFFPFISNIRIIHSISNPSQLQAIKTVYKNRLSVIYGPAGTGKTQTCVNAALHLLCLENGAVMLVAPSNYAADHLYVIMKSTMAGLRLNFKIVRMLSLKREQLQLQQKPENDDMPDTALLHNAVRCHPMWTADPAMLNTLEKDESTLTYRERNAKLAYIRQIEHDILKSARVIIATVGAASDTRLDSLVAEFKNSPRKLSALIIDEASLLSVPGIVPLMSLQPNRICLAGDDARLSNVVSSETALNACLDVSCMTLLRMTPYFKDNNVITLLDQQYRMCSQIASIVSQYAYGGHLNSHSTVITRNYKEHPKFAGLCHEFPELRNSNIAIYTYDYNDVNTLGEKEAEITLDLVKKLLAVGTELNSIVVLSMHDSNAKLLIEHAQKLELTKRLQICNIETFHGKEKSIVILNLACSNLQDKGRHLGHKNRLVVGLSRALDYLMIVGDTKTIEGSNNPDLVGLIENMKQSGAFVIKK